jgi:hypothetical protein
MFPEIERERFSEAVSLLSQGLDSLRSLGMTRKQMFSRAKRDYPSFSSLV